MKKMMILVLCLCGANISYAMNISFSTAAMMGQMVEAFLDAVQKGDSAIVEGWLKLGMPVNVRGGEALHQAVKYGRLDVARILFARGAKVHRLKKRELWDACMDPAINSSNQLEMVKLLVANGVDIFADGSELFHYEGVIARIKYFLSMTTFFEDRKLYLLKARDYLAPFEERRCILAALLACEELGCNQEKDFPPELMATGWPLAAIMESVVLGDGQ